MIHKDVFFQLAQRIVYIINSFLLYELHLHLGHIKPQYETDLQKFSSRSDHILMMHSERINKQNKLKKHNGFTPTTRWHLPCVHFSDIFNIQLIPAVIAFVMNKYLAALLPLELKYFYYDTIFLLTKCLGIHFIVIVV